MTVSIITDVFKRKVSAFDLQAKFFAQGNAEFQRIDGIEAQPFAKERFIRRNVFHPQIFKLKGADNQLLNL